MSDRPIAPATRADLVQSLAHGLRYDGKRLHHKVDGMMSQIVAEMLVDHLERSGFEICQRISEYGPGPDFPAGR